MVHDGVPVLAGQDLRKTERAVRRQRRQQDALKGKKKSNYFERRLIGGLSANPLGDRRYADESLSIIKKSDNDLSCSGKSKRSCMFQPEAKWTTHLEHGQDGGWESVKVRCRRLVFKVKPMVKKIF